MAEIDALIAKLEQATGENNRLDDDIARLIGGKPGTFSYTGSIDAALSLVPEGWSVHWWRSGDGLPNAEVHKEQGCTPYYGHGAPAIALCIAALRARKVTNG